MTGDAPVDPVERSCKEGRIGHISDNRKVCLWKGGNWIRDLRCGDAMVKTSKLRIRKRDQAVRKGSTTNLKDDASAFGRQGRTNLWDS
jgi:hypothetical protein